MLLKVFHLTCLCYLLTFPQPSYTQGSCVIDGIGPNDWMFGFNITIRDTDVGITFSGTTNIELVPPSTRPVDLPPNNGPYLDFHLQDGKFIASLLDNFQDFEEYETSTNMANNILLSCSLLPLSIVHHITDTNNHYPVFLDDNIEISIVTPINTGVRIPYEIRVRDVDLTTTAIDFDIVGDSPLFEVVYERRDGKTFYGALRAISDITGLNEPLVLMISATDVDNTGDELLTAYSTITVISDPVISSPPAPVFSQQYYSGSYSTESGLLLAATIQLVQGYSEDVEFTLSGAYAHLFDVNVEGRVATLHVRDRIPATIMENYSNLVVVVLATNSLSSVASAPVFIELPLPRAIRFERDQYIGAIYGTTLSLEPIEVIEGFSDDLVFTLIGDLEEYFNFFVVSNLVVIMNDHRPLPADFVRNYDFLNLILEVTGPNTIRTVVGITLAVEGYDDVTPVFTQAYYTGSYDSHAGLRMDQPIALSQGFDNTVSIGLSGGSSNFFRVTNTGSNINVVHSDIPPSVIEDNSNLLFYITANKPRTVGATATVYISLPQANILQFTQNNYVGTFDGDDVKLTTISLTENNYENLNFELSGTHAAYFTKTVVGNSVTIGSQDAFPESIIEENDFVYLELHATGFNSIATSTVITLTVIKDDSNTPIFSSSIYSGTYDLINGLIMDSDIYLSQGFDNTVSFHKDEGDFNLLRMTKNLNSITLEVTDTIPMYVIETNSNLLFAITAVKEGTVGATAAVNIALPEAGVLQFEYPSYTGRIWLGHEYLDVYLPPITLSKGFQDGVIFSIQEGYQNYFHITYEDNVVTFRTTDELLSADVENFYDLINIVLTATGRNSIPATTVLSLEVITADTNTPIFTKSIYEGSYDSDTGLILNEEIYLAQGFDDTVLFSLSGDVEYFEILPHSHPVMINVLSPIPVDFMRKNRHILLTVIATKEWTVGASSTLQINLPSFAVEPIMLQFQEALYSGQIQGDNIILEPIPLPSGYGADVMLFLDGDYHEHFAIRRTEEAPQVEIVVATSLPADVLESNTFINLVITAEGTTEDHISSFAVIVLEVVSDTRELIVPVFSQPYYLATYTPPNFIAINNGPISLSDGYDDDVEFALVGAYEEYFSVQQLGNFISVGVTTPLPSNVITSNAFINLQLTAFGTNHQDVTVIITTTIASDNLVPPEFNAIYYTGTLALASNTISINGLIFLLPGFDPLVQFSIEGDFQDYFTVTSTFPSLTIARTNVPIPEQVLIDNSFFNLILTASTSTLSASVIVTLDIDSGEIVAVFNAEYYTGMYSPITGITLNDEISITSGFDATVQYSLTGEFAEYFTADPPTNPVTITTPDGVPTNVLAENTFITLILTVTGPSHVPVFRTITLEMISDTLITPEFSDIFYTGTLLAPSTITLNAPIQITAGFDESLELVISGEFEQYFSATPVTNPATITVTSPLPSDVLTENTFVTLVLTATGPNHVPVTTTVTLEIADLISPAFDQVYYTGILTLPNSINLNNPIIVSEGFDDNLQFGISGEFGIYFTATSTGTNSVNIDVSDDFPSDLVNANTFITLVLTASSPYHYTVTATVTLEIADLITPQFDQIFYTGSLTVPDVVELHNPIIVSEGFDDSLQFTINGDFEAYFTSSASDRVVSISVTNPLPNNILAENTYITLVLTAFGTNHETVTVTVSLEIINFLTPVFGEIFYNGILNLPDQITLNDPIVVTDGFDNSLVFTVSGEYENYFSAIPSSDGTITLAVSSALPTDTITDNAFITLLVTASGPNHATATTTINLEIADLITPVFDQTFYTGTLTIPNTIDLHSPITVSEGFDDSLQFSVGEEFIDYFSTSPNIADGTVSIAVTGTLPNDVLNYNTYITLILIASGPNHVATRTTLSLEIIGLTTPVFNQIYYTGLLTLPEEISLNNPILMTEGFDDTLNFDVGGEYGGYFTATGTEGAVNIAVSSQLPSDTINANAFITLTLTAYGPNHRSVTTTVSLEIAELIEPVFDRLFYTGSLTPPIGIVLDSPITISSGFDDTLQHSISGDYGNYFTTTVTGNTIGISVTEPLPIDVLNDNTFITLVITVFGTNHATVTTTVTIEIINLITPAFNQIFYVGTLRLPEEIVLDTSIVVTEGFDETIQFVLNGEFGSYFSASSSLDGIITLAVSGDLPSDTINENTFITLVLTASGPNHVTVTTVITLEIAELITPIFDQIFYTGTLTLPDEIVLSSPITLSEGFDNSLEFSVGEEYIDYFSVTPNEADGTISIEVIAAIPNEILDANTYITLVLIASGPNHVITRTTLSLELIGLTTPVFDQIFYTGVLNLPNDVTLNTPILISQGFDTSLQFTVTGEYGDYFSASASEAGSITVDVSSELPSDTINANAFITLIVTASGPNHITTTNTLTLEITDLITPIFDEIFYVGTMTLPDVIELSSPIIVSEGFDDTLQFSISGEFENYFTAEPTANGAAITATNQLPSEVLTNNRFITLILTASGPNHVPVTTTVTLEILDLVLPIFNQVFYTGVLTPHDITLHNPILVVEGFDETLVFDVDGEYGDYFDATSGSGEVTIIIVNDLPSETLNENAYITLVLSASGPNHITVLTTISLELAELIVPTFSELFYTGVHSPNGIELNSAIIVTSEFDETLQFAIVGEFAEYFTAIAEGTEVNIGISIPVPSEIIYTNTFITLVLAASGPYHTPENVIITLEIITDEAIVTRFEELFYTGVYNYPIGVELDSDIILSQGFDELVTFTLSGEFASHFTAIPPSNPVAITATEVLPNEVVVGNAIISLILTAIGPTHVPTTTIVTLEIVLLDEVPPVFDQVFYEGTYTSPGQIDFQNPIALDQGFDENVIFAISGDQSQYFSVTQNTNQAVITAPEPIPQQVIEDYTNLIFIITATKSGTATASASIRINLPRVLVNVLRFEQDSYIGYIEDGVLNLESIVLVEGYNGAVTYDMQGVFSDHFVYSAESNTVTISLQEPLPEDIVQQATFVNMVLAASATGYSVATTTAITISVNPIQTLVPVFSQTSYTGSYTAIDGLIFDNEIVLTQGFDDTVTFELSGGQSTSFTLTYSGNLAQISVEEPIPAEIIAANNHLLFSVNAVKEGTPGGSSAIMIQLLDGDHEGEQTEPTTLGFSQNSYTFTVTSNRLGLIGSVTASANTGETVSYNLETANEHLSQRIQIGSTNGQIILTNYPNTGLYQVMVMATTINTAVTATVSLSLRVDSVFICNNNNFLLDPIIVIEQVEEQAFSDIVILNEELAGACTYVITDSWPQDQPWFTIADNNLVSTAVDREDPSIAFMKLSQVQIELSLDCGTAQNALSRPGYNSSRTRRNAPFNIQADTDDGDRTWLLANEIRFTLDRRVVNVVILDINDNAPIFDDSENEPVIVGYPDANTLDIIRPQYLTRVHATDADIGINAHIRYTVTDARFSIHPDTGVVYLMPDAMETLTDGLLFDVFATDEYGLGNVGILNMRVRLLSMQHIVVLSINNAYLESQEDIRDEMVNSLNYRVQILSAAVIPNMNPENDEETPDIEPEAPEPEVDITTDGTTVDPDEEPEEGPEEEPGEVDLIRTNKNNQTKVTTRNVESAPLLTLYIYALDDQSDLVNADTLLEEIQNGGLENFSWTLAGQTLAEYTYQSFWSGLVITIFVLGGVLLLICITFVGVLWYRIRQSKYKKFEEEASVDSDKATSRNNNSITIPQTPNIQPSLKQIYKQPEVTPSSFGMAQTTEAIGPTVVVTDETGLKIKSSDDGIYGLKDRSKSFVKFNDRIDDIVLQPPTDEFAETMNEFHRL